MAASPHQSAPAPFDTAAIMGGLYGDGIIALPGAFTAEWADALRADIERLFAEAQAVEGGSLPRGPERFYVEVHPERIAGFVDIVTHPVRRGQRGGAWAGLSYRRAGVRHSFPGR